MKHILTEQERQFIIETLAKGEPLPMDFKYKLFPTSQKEYELNYAGKMRKQDILKGEDGVLPVPLQVEKIFNGERELFDDGWRNMIVFGDNLQFLKTCYQNTDELIKNKVKGKVKLIYIDPPFATASDFSTKTGQKAYTDKTKGADFVEFLRKRLVLAKELLSENGFICVHLDYKKVHYIKLVLDELFGENNFRNEVIVRRTQKNFLENEYIKTLNTAVDTILIYSKNEASKLKPVYKIVKKEESWHSLDAPNWSGNRPNLVYELFGKMPPESRCWSWKKERSDKAILEGKLRANPQTGKPEYLIPAREKMLCTSLWDDITAYSFGQDYPTEKKESLLLRIIDLCTDENDLVLDFFGGSGTTAAVAEKLGRKWITCDIGKLSFYTMQKRILTIQDSKDLTNTSKKFEKKAKSFFTLNVGHYDLGKLFDLGKEKYINFVLPLFEIEKYAKPKKIKGYEICGERNGSYSFVWEYWKYSKEANVDIDFLEELHENLKNSIGRRFYIIAPANAIDFISDYYEIDNIRYYFLKVPYQVIQELHKEQFKKFRQPQSKNKINDVDNAVGFHFSRQPEVKSKFTENDLVIQEFRSNYTEEETDREMDNFESLSMIIVDKNFNGKEFTMSEYYFAADLLKKQKKDEEDTNIQEELKQMQELKISITNCGSKICVKYIDIYGNEFTEELKTSS